MSTVRACSRDDLSAIAELYVRVFARGRPIEGPHPAGYLGELYLSNPWYDPDSPPLVFEDRDGRVVGFIGAVPMPWRMGGRKLRLVVGGNFMVDPASNDPFAAPRLLKTFLAGPHDIALTDTANPVAIRMWQGLGGELARFQSMRWVLSLRPASLGVALARRSASLGRLTAAVSPVARVVDRVAMRWSRSGAEPADGVISRVVDASFVHSFVTDLDDPTQVQFAGSADEFRWLTAMAGRKTQFGPIRLLAVSTRGGAAQGVVIYYPNRNGIGQIALTAAAPGEYGHLLSALRRDALEQGSAGLMGQAESKISFELRDLPCAYLYRNSFVMLHSREPGLTTPLRTGDIALGRLCGEWWARTMGDTF